MKRYHWALIIIWTLTPLSYCFSQGIEEIVIINKYEDNTADLIDTLTFFDDSPHLSLQEGEGYYSDASNELAKPHPIFGKIEQSAVTIPQKNVFSNTMQVSTGSTQSLDNRLTIETAHLSYLSETESAPGKIQQNDQLAINMSRTLSIPFATEFRGSKKSLTVGTGSGIIYRGTVVLVNLLCLAGYESNPLSPYIAGSMTTEWFNHGVDGDFSVDKAHMGLTSRYLLRSAYCSITAAQSAIFSENRDFTQKYSVQTTFFWQPSSLSLFLIDTGYIKKYDIQDLFPLYEKWAGGISYNYAPEYFFIRSALFLTGKYNPLTLQSSGYRFALPLSVTTFSAGITLPRFQLAASLSAKTDYTALSSLQGSIGMYDLHWSQFTINIEESILADSVFTDFTFDNKVKICYRFAALAMIFTEIKMIAALSAPKYELDTAITCTLGCTVQL